jgi:two-component system, chemotaxis family, sensor kinase CheA
VTFDETRQAIEAELNQLACEQIVSGVNAAATRRVLDGCVARLEGTPDGVELAEHLRNVAASAISDHDKVTFALSIVAGDVTQPLPAAESTSEHQAQAAPEHAAEAVVDELEVLRSDPDMASLFIGEALDHLGTIEAALLALDERPGDVTLLNDIFRPFHTVKGNASALGLVSIQNVAHAVENLLDLARAGKYRIGSADVDLILKSVDLLCAMVKDVSARLEGAPPAALADRARMLIESVSRAISGEEASPSAPEREPASAAPVVPDNDGEPLRRSEDRSGQVSIKVDTRKLDSLVDAVGELLIVQSLIHEDAGVAAGSDDRLSRNLAQLKRITAELQRNALAMRMVPIRQAFQKVSRVVRDLSKRAGKPVELVLTGEDTELDRKMVEDITDPLMHMVRNSIDHGLESQDARLKAGKRAQGRLSLSASHQGGRVVIEIADDGGGLNTEKILARGRERGLVPEGVTPPVEEIHMLIFEPGFSTADKITEISGRGVGMDVVRRNIEALRGRVEIRSERGRGTTFAIKLPLTLAVLDGLLVARGGQVLVMPAAAVRESLRPTETQVHQVQGKPRLLQVRDSLVPLADLAEMWGTGEAKDPTQGVVVVIEDDGRRLGIVVDELLSKQEVVIKSLGETFQHVEGVAGGAILGDGRVGLILDPHGIFGMIRTDRAA